jgi:putative DNA primase/helicase
MHTSNKATPGKKPNCNQKLVILATEFHIERRASYYKIRFRDLDGQKQTIAIGRELFTVPSKVVAELLKANADLPDNPNAAAELVKRAVANRSTRSRRITTRTGLYDTSFVYPGQTFGPLEGKLKLEDTSAVDPALGLKRGSLQGWREGLTSPFRYSDYLILAASAAFSGPLFELAGEQEGVVFHFQPQNSAPDDNASRTKSSSGKTLAARVAISTIGRARKSDLISFAVTERGLEDYCFGHNNLIGALHEEGRALSGTGKHVKPSQLAYQLTSGRGTYRSQKAIRDPDLRNLTWLLPFVSTGEKPLDDSKHKAARMEGAQVRMAPIPVPAGADGGIFNRLDGSREAIVEKAHLLFREVEVTLAENHGVAMPAHLGKLWPPQCSLAPRVRRIMDKFVKKVGADFDPWERRFAEKFGIVLAGAIFASEFGVAPWTKRRAWRAVRTIYQRSRAALTSVSETTDALVREIRKALATDRFPRLEKGQKIMKPEDAGRALGVTRKLATHGPTLLITLDQLKGLIGPRAASSPVLADLEKRGILIQSTDGKWTRETMIRGLNGSKRRRYVALKLSALMEAS